MSSVDVVLLISEDPRASHRANEAIRIGVGIVSGENQIAVVLRGPALHLLDADTDDLVDGDDIAKFRAALRNLGVPFHVEAAAIPDDPDWNADGHPVVHVDGPAITALLRQGRRTMVF